VKPRLPPVSVVVPTFQRRQRLPRLLAPLLSDAATHEVVVVDDGSTDGSAELLACIADDNPRVRVVRTPNRGQAPAQDLGASLAAGDVVLFIDDDVVPRANLVSGHSRRHTGEPNLVVVGYMPVLPASDTRMDWIVQRYAREYALKVAEWERAQERILLGLWGGNVSLRRTHLDKVPLAAPDYHIRYHVDLDFGLRCRRAGLQAVFDRSLDATHEYSRTVDGFLRDQAASAADRVILHRMHADVLGPLPEPYFRSDASLPARIALRVLRGRGSRSAQRLLESVVARAGRHGRSRVEAQACDLLQRLAGQQIARGAQMEGLAPGPRPAQRRTL
jgi:glycosyltransferase involved in cell wall biosynthesis